MEAVEKREEILKKTNKNAARQVTTEIYNEELLITQIQEILNEWVVTLTPILRDSIEDKGPDKSDIIIELVPLAESIRDLNMRLVMIRDNLENLLDRIEL